MPIPEVEDEDTRLVDKLAVDGIRPSKEEEEEWELERADWFPDHAKWFVGKDKKKYPWNNCWNFLQKINTWMNKMF